MRTAFCFETNCSFVGLIRLQNNAEEYSIIKDRLAWDCPSNGLS